ncbi:polysaccharide pyruvyl transferase family protein [bacterium]|nr:hypothetical protein [bacterium]MBU3955580.1 polysaccharide pyruvyl transferase family protein [bacterium]
MTKRIFAAGYFGYGNFGDELILDIFNLRMSGWRVTRVKRMKTKPFAALMAIINSDAVVFPGGSIFQDETSSLSLFFYAAVIFAAALAGKPVFLLDSGLEVKKPLNKVILRMALKLAAFVSVRDSASFALARTLGIKPLKSADCAFSLENIVSRGLFPPKTIGVIPRGNGIRGTFQKAIELCGKKYPEAEFKFAVLSGKDLPLAKELGRVRGLQPLIIKNRNHMEKFFGECDFFILAPFHALVIGASSGAKFAAIAYSVKVTNFLTDMGMESCIFPGDESMNFLENGKNQARRMRIAEECAFQIFLNLLKDKLKL